MDKVIEIGLHNDPIVESNNIVQRVVPKFKPIDVNKYYEIADNCVEDKLVKTLNRMRFESAIEDDCIFLIDISGYCELFHGYTNEKLFNQETLNYKGEKYYKVYSVNPLQDDEWVTIYLKDVNNNKSFGRIDSAYYEPRRSKLLINYTNLPNDYINISVNDTYYSNFCKYILNKALHNDPHLIGRMYDVVLHPYEKYTLYSYIPTNLLGYKKNHVIRSLDMTITTFNLLGWNGPKQIRCGLTAAKYIDDYICISFDILYE